MKSKVKHTQLRRQAMLLLYAEGWSVTSIAKAWGLSVQRVSIILERKPERRLPPSGAAKSPSTGKRVGAR